MSATYTKANIKKEKLIRFTYRCLFFIITLVIPCLIWGLSYKFMYTRTIHRISILFLLVTYVLCKRFKNNIKEWINSWEYSSLKYILLGIGRCIWYIILFAFCIYLSYKLPKWFDFAKEQADILLKTFQKFLLCLSLTAACQLVGDLVIYPLENKYDYLIKRELRKQETREANAEQNEAIRNIIREEMNK